eukprot:scaffold20758_cov74-Cyclotella_meneghiniana.AAC.4
MPSRKKAQGKARKAKQAAESRGNPSQDNDVSGSCNHIGERNWSESDYDAALDLYDDYIEKYKDLHFGYEIYILANEIYDKYFHLSDARKELFRRMILAFATENCVVAVKEKDLTVETSISGTSGAISMIKTIEVRDKHNRANDQNIQIEIGYSLRDIHKCPRQIIRFLHRRNSCACLHQIYYKLKETTKKTSYCCKCKKIVEIKQLSRCDVCNLAQYCSYECARADWPEHKWFCEQLQNYKTDKPAKSENDLEA